MADYVSINLLFHGNLVFSLLYLFYVRLSVIILNFDYVIFLTPFRFSNAYAPRSQVLIESYFSVSPNYNLREINIQMYLLIKSKTS